MLTAYPVLAGLHLNAADEHLLDYWCATETTYRKHIRIPPAGILAQGLHLILDCGLDDLRELMDWNLPLQVVANLQSRPHASRMQLYRDLFESGIAACWEIPAPDQTITLPFLSLPPRKGCFYMIQDDNNLARHYRQIGAFAGYDARADFRTAGELITAFEAALNENVRPQIPEFMLVDLDSERSDPLELFSELGRLLQAQPQHKAHLQLLITKDFARPGLDVPTIEKIVRPYARRIFHPLEAIYVLLEALYLNTGATGAHSKQSRSEQPGPAYRSLQELLYGHQQNLQTEVPRPFLTGDQAQTSRAVQPFLWMYHYLAESRARGATLTPLIS